MYIVGMRGKVEGSELSALDQLLYIRWSSLVLYELLEQQRVHARERWRCLSTLDLPEPGSASCTEQCYTEYNQRDDGGKGEESFFTVSAMVAS